MAIVYYRNNVEFFHINKHRLSLPVDNFQFRDKFWRMVTNNIFMKESFSISQRTSIHLNMHYSKDKQCKCNDYCCMTTIIFSGFLRSFLLLTVPTLFIYTLLYNRLHYHRVRQPNRGEGVT